MKNYLKFCTSVIVSIIAGVIGIPFNLKSIPIWYSTLNKPWFTPPDFLFGPVWTVLYILIGTSFFLIWQKGFNTKTSKTALTLFGVQIFLNAAWSPVFFGLRNIFLGLIVILVLWFFIFKTILVFSKINKVAAYLLYPYLVWVSFASILNLSLFILNR